MSDLTRAYIVGAWLKAKDDLTEARALAPFRDDKNQDQIRDLMQVVSELWDLYGKD